MKHFLTIDDLSRQELVHLLELSHELRRQRQAGQANEPILAGRTLGMLFAKPSLRTRVSFEQAMYELGGQAISLQQSEVGLGARECAGDVARVLSGMVDGIMVRVFDHAHLEEMAEGAMVPVINALSDTAHPCQPLADLMALQDEFGMDLTGRTLAYVGDGNNVARSLARTCALMGIRFVIASPPGYALEADLFDQIRQVHADAELHNVDDPAEAVRQADAVYTDTWVSMGQEAEQAERARAFEAFQVNDALLSCAPDHAIALHCLPAHRGVEITDAVMDGPRSRVFAQAHNRLHSQKGLLAMLIGHK